MGRGVVCTGFRWENEGKTPLERPRLRWEFNIKMCLQDGGCGEMDWIELDHGKDRWRALESPVMNFRFP